MVDDSQNVRAYVGLGSNLGDREANIRRALDELGRREGIALVNWAGMLETDPVGGPEGQGPYLNFVAALDTTLTPRALLEVCMDIEHTLGRVRDVRWWPRTIDIDILLYGDEVVWEPDLEIPHPRMHEREFVLSLLAEIAPDARHPRLGKTVKELLDMLTSRWGVERDACVRDARNPKGN